MRLVKEGRMTEAGWLPLTPSFTSIFLAKPVKVISRRMRAKQRKDVVVRYWWRRALLNNTFVLMQGVILLLTTVTPAPWQLRKRETIQIQITHMCRHM